MSEIADLLDMQKYTKKGAYHWYLYRNDVQYKNSVNHTYKVIHKLEPDKNITIMDFGCGDGLYTHLFARAKYNVIGVDKNPLAIELARHIHLATWHGVGKLHPIQFKVGDVKAIKNVDVVLMFDVFEHLLNPEKVVRILYDNCKRLYILNPNWSSDNHVKLYTEDDFNRLFDVADWNIQKIEDYYNKTLFMMERK